LGLIWPVKVGLNTEGEVVGCQLALAHHRTFRVLTFAGLNLQRSKSAHNGRFFSGGSGGRPDGSKCNLKIQSTTWPQASSQ